MFKAKKKALKRTAEEMAKVVEKGEDDDRDGRKGKRKRRRRNKKAKGRKKCN